MELVPGVSDIVTLKEVFDRALKYDGRPCPSFSMIAKPPSLRPDLCALVKLETLVPGVGMMVHCEDGYLRINVDPHQLVRAASFVDILYLVRCGVRYDADVGSLWF